MYFAVVGLPLVLALALGTSASPVKETLAYSREMTSGIPGDSVGGLPGRNIHTSYFIYVVLVRDAAPTAASVWVKGKYYGATLQKVSSPIVVDRDPAVPTGKKDTLVPATSSAVYQVDPNEEEAFMPKNGLETRFTSSNEVVVFLHANKAVWYGTVKTITPLASTAAP
jgi:hypothetical protein